MPKTRGRLLVTVVAAAAMVLTLLPLGAAPAGAVAPTDQPMSLSPDGPSVSGNPQLSWGAVEGAARYRVQVSSNSAFTGTLLANVVTYNRRYSPPAALPVGTIYWRVAGLDTGSGQGPWSGVAEFTRQLTAPTQQAPADGADIDYPGTAVAFSWAPTPETRSYVLQIDENDSFTSPTQIVTRTTSHIPLNLGAPGETYYWRVRSSSVNGGGGINSEWSDTRSYDLAWAWVDGDRIQAPVLVSPTPSQANVTDVAFEWKPVPGATVYNLEVDPSIEFSAPTLRATNVHSSHFVLSQPLANASYWWRVQAVDPEGNLGPWSQPRQFTRNWLAAPTLELPAESAGPTVGGDLTFSWSSVDHASDYDVQFSTSEFFDSGTTCRTVQTRIQLGFGCNFNPNVANGFYWRVRGIDAGGAYASGGLITGVWSAGRFHRGHAKPAVTGTFVPTDVPTRLSPADCLDCTPWTATPTFSWTPMPGATSYRLILAKDANFTTLISNITLTNQTTYTPTAELEDSDVSSSYFWYVQACVGASCGPSPIGALPALPSSRFEKASVRVRLNEPTHGPSSEVANYTRFTWEPYLTTTSTDAPDPMPTTALEARAYQIQVSRVSTFETLIDDKTVNQPAYTAWDRTYEEGPIYWRVRALDASQNRLAWSQATVESGPSEARSFTKKSPAPVPAVPGNGASVNGATTFSWTPLAFANGYELEVYREVDGQPSFSAANRAVRIVTKQRSATVTQTLTPGTYRWRIRRSDADNRWGAWSNDVQSPTVGGPTFTVLPGTPSLVSPADNATVGGNDLAFAWTPVAGAATYRFQRAADANFTASVQNTSTVMSSYAPTDQWALGTYYWRVQALDSFDQVMGTSPARRIAKDILPGAPTNVTATPADSAVNLRWTAPPATGGTAIVGYVVTPYIGNTAQSPRISMGTGTTLRVGELVNGTAYRFRVTAANGGGQGAQSAFSNTVTPSAGPSLPPGAVYVPVTPCRVVDTRAGGTGNGALVSNEQRDYRIAGSGARFQVQGGKAGGCGIPDGVDAVEVSVTSTAQNASGFFRAWPTGQAQPNATFLNYAKGKSITNTGAITLAPTGETDLRVLNAGGRSHYVLDVQGYYVDGSGAPVPNGTVYVPITPCRVVDTRTTSAMISGSQRNYKVAGSGLGGQGGAAGGCGIPETATAVEASVTSTAQSGAGYFRAWPMGEAEPNATFLNYARQQGVTNTGAIKVSTTSASELTVKNYGIRSHFVIDVQGYFISATTPGSVYVAITPCRVVDTRARGGVLQPGAVRNFLVAGSSPNIANNQGGRSGGCGIPEEAGAIEASVTAVGPTGAGYFRAYPAGQSEPNATFLNYIRGESVTNTGAIKVATTGANDLAVRNLGGPSHYVIDVQGYFLATS